MRLNVELLPDEPPNSHTDSENGGVKISTPVRWNKPIILTLWRLRQDCLGWGYVESGREKSMPYALQSIEILTRKAEKEGVILALEHLSPISSNLINTAADLKMVLDQIPSPNLKAMLDTCQVCLVGEHVRDYFEALGKDLIHIHIVDGTPGGHLAFGDGTIPLQEFVETIGAYGYTGFLSMEISDRRYFEKPELADKQSMDLFRKWIG